MTGAAYEYLERVEKFLKEEGIMHEMDVLVIRGDIISITHFHGGAQTAVIYMDYESFEEKVWYLIKYVYHV